MSKNKRNKSLGEIVPPILVLTETHEVFERFWRQAGLQQDEVKWIHALSDIRGFQDKTMMLVGYFGNIPDYHLILDYAKQHNIQIVRA